MRDVVGWRRGGGEGGGQGGSVCEARMFFFEDLYVFTSVRTLYGLY